MPPITMATKGPLLTLVTLPLMGLEKMLQVVLGRALPCLLVEGHPWPRRPCVLPVSKKRRDGSLFTQLHSLKSDTNFLCG